MMRHSLTVKGVGAVIALGGFLILYALAVEGYRLALVWREAEATGQGGIARANAILLLLLVLFSSASLVGGSLLLLSRSRGRLLSLAALVPQSVWLGLPRFQYRLTPIGFCGVSISRIGSLFQYGFAFDGKTKFDIGFDLVQDWYVRMNLLSVLLMALLLSFSDRNSKQPVV
jgi:hypothetical protein